MAEKQLMKLSRSEFRKYALKTIAMSQLIASFTPTSKDDAFIDLMASLITNDGQFNALCNILGITD